MPVPRYALPLLLTASLVLAIAGWIQLRWLSGTRLVAVAAIDISQYTVVTQPLIHEIPTWRLPAISAERYLTADESVGMIAAQPIPKGMPLMPWNVSAASAIRFTESHPFELVSFDAHLDGLEPDGEVGMTCVDITVRPAAEGLPVARRLLASGVPLVGIQSGVYGEARDSSMRGVSVAAEPEVAFELIGGLQPDGAEAVVSPSREPCLPPSSEDQDAP